jgi:hypothetical protein
VWAAGRDCLKAVLDGGAVRAAERNVGVKFTHSGQVVHRRDEFLMRNSLLLCVCRLSVGLRHHICSWQQRFNGTGNGVSPSRKGIELGPRPQVMPNTAKRQRHPGPRLFPQ